MRKPVNTPFLLLVCVLITAGLIIFTSAALGLLARGGQATFTSVAVSQVLLGLLFGGVAMLVMSRIDYRLWKRYTPHFFIFAVLLTMLTFVPHVGLSLNGAHRWIQIGPVTLQPVEVLKFAVVAFLAAVYAEHLPRIGRPRESLLPLIYISGIACLILIMQPNTGGVAIIVAASLSMFFAAGGKLRYMLVIALIVLMAVGVLAYERPYLRARFVTYINPSQDMRGASFQVTQSLIAVGSGGILGRGFGQSIEKFSYLPEPIGDSIFAVVGEEFGLWGTTLLVLLYFTFALLGLRIASRAADSFGALMVVGFVVLIAGQSFYNIAATLGILPLAGVPLIFVSHGGTALAVAMAEVGVILSVSRRMKTG